MGASNKANIRFQTATISKQQAMDESSEEDLDEGERTPPKRIVQQRGTFSSFQNDKMSFKNRVFAEDKQFKIPPVN